MMRGELYINGTLADLEKEISASLTFAITDIKRPDTRNGSYSKTITLIGTKSMNTLMTNIYDVAYSIQTSGTVNFTPDFNSNLKASIVFLVDGLTQFRGYMKLNKINRSQQDLEKISYDVTLFGDVATIFGNLGDAKMSDLSLSEYNHTYNKTTQKATWTNTNYGSGYVYPMINYRGTNPSSWDVNDFYPAVYLKTYIDKIFNYAGFVYSSTFLNSAEFKRYVIPFSGDALRLTSTQITNRIFSATVTTNTSGVASTASSLNSTIIFNNETVDVGGVYDPVTGYFTATSGGFYDFQFNGSVTVDAVTAVTYAGTGFDVHCLVNFVHVRGATTTTIPCAGFYVPAVGSFVQGYNFGTFTAHGTSQNVQILTGDTVHVQIQAYIMSGNTGTWGFNLLSGAKFNDRISNTIVTDGDTVDMSMVVPIDIRQADLLMSVIRMFNLFVEPDRTQPNKLIIDTYDDFYGSGLTPIWEGTDGNGMEIHKMDVSKQVQITPMGALDALRYVISYSEDSDYWNRFYIDKWGEIYGQKNYDVVNDFLKNVNENKVLFAPTPNIGSSSHDRVYPEIVTLNSSGQQQATRSKLRLLYWAGSLTTSYSYTYTSVSGSTTETTYPYAGHLDNPYTPSIDLSFWMPREIYYLNSSGTTQYTTNNLYNRFHAKHLTEITDKNSKILTAFFRLRPIDIFNLSFRDKIFIDGQYYRLQKIYDYDPLSEGVTKVDLLKIKAGQSFVPLAKALNGTYGELLDPSNPAPVYSGTVGASLNDPSGTMAVGSANMISRSSVGCMASGSQNRIGDNCYNVSIFNSSGVSVMAGISNVTVMGTNNITVNESNVSYINGVRTQGSNDSYTVTTSQTVYNAGSYYVSGAITVTLSTSNLTTNSELSFKKTDGGTNTVINGGGVNIDGSSTYVLRSQYTSITLVYNGSQYYIKSVQDIDNFNDIFLLGGM